MGTRTVYCFDFYEPATGRLVHSPRAATIDRIERMDGVPLRDTGLEVDEDEVDANGFLLGKANCNHPSHTRNSGQA